MICDKVECKNYILAHNTPEGSRTPAACLEGKHDNRFTTGVLYMMCITRVYMCVQFAESFCFCVIGQLGLHFICV